MITFDAVTMAVEGGADTYQKIANVLGVSVEDPDLAAAVNFMRHQYKLGFANDCRCEGMEHTYDCRLILP